jgi:hypothetical protein
MYEPIGEKIAVVGAYNGGEFAPKKFRWREHLYPIQMITFVTDIRDGRTLKRRYCVTSGPQAYRLLFDRIEENWQLEELWVE